MISDKTIKDNLIDDEPIRLNDGYYDLVKRKKSFVSYTDSYYAFKTEINSTNGANVHKNRIFGLMKKYFR